MFDCVKAVANGGLGTRQVDITLTTNPSHGSGSTNFFGLPGTVATEEHTWRVELECVTSGPTTRPV